MSKTVADEFFDALKNGDLDFFTERLQETIPMADVGYVGFAKVVQSWMMQAGQDIQVVIDDLMAVYRYIGGNETINAKRFGFLCARHELKSKQLRVKGIQRRVFDLQFAKREYAEWLNRSTKPTLVTVKKEETQ